MATYEFIQLVGGIPSEVEGVQGTVAPGNTSEDTETAPSHADIERIREAQIGLLRLVVQQAVRFLRDKTVPIIETHDRSKPPS